MEYLIGIDLGTSSTKTVLFDTKGQALASATVEYPLLQPQNGWAEQEPGRWWEACLSTLRTVISQSGVGTDQIKGIGISGQMHGLVMLDDAGEVLRNCILWCDGRTTAECEEITRRVGAQRMIEIAANPALTGFTAGKILWVQTHEPELYAKCKKILLPKDYLRYMLTGEYATEVSDASGTNLLDITTRQWSGEILEKLEIDPDLLPPVFESSDVCGRVTPQAAALCGLAPGTPVVGGAGDNAAAAVGTGVVVPGSAFATIGTSGVIFAHSESVRIDPLGRVHTFCSAVPGTWAVMSCTLAAGLSLQWFRNNFCIAEIETASGLDKDPYQIMDEQAARIPIGAGRLLYLPYLMGERSPLLDARARGVFFGLSAIHSKYDMLRAVMEGVAFSQRQCLDVLQEMGIACQELVATGGGGTSTLWRQMLADVFEAPVCTVANREGPALGAAILAGVGAGIFEDVPTACAHIIQRQKQQQPLAENTRQYQPYYQLYRELYPAMKDSFAKLADL